VADVACRNCGAVVDGAWSTCPRCGRVSVRLRVVAGLLSVAVPGAGLFLRHRARAAWTVLLVCLPLIIAGVVIIASVWDEPSIPPSGWLAVIMLIAAVGPYTYGILASAQRGLATTRVSTSAQPGEGVRLTVHRGGDVTLDAYQVYLDGMEVGGLQGNARLEITVAPGHHSLAVGAQGERSQALEFDVRLGHDLSFDCGHRLTDVDVAGGVVDTLASEVLFGRPSGFPASYWVRPSGESAVKEP
jgi:hypothetical protein